MQLKTLQDAMQHFSIPKNCTDYVIALRWPDGKVSCPTCGSEAVTWMPTRSLFQCKTRHPKRQFSVKVGTVMEDSPIALDKWLVVMWMLMNCRNGISSYEVARTIGITQKSAWFMLHRIREGMNQEDMLLFGEVECDESYVGGLPKNKHVKARKQGKYSDKAPVFGMVERGGRAKVIVPPDAKAATIVPLITNSIASQSTVITDAHVIYDSLGALSQNYEHLVIDHRQDFFKRGSACTNAVENLWSCFKRTLGGTYISVTRKHLGAYAAEQVFRFNHRKGYSEEVRFQNTLKGIQGKRLTYKELIAG